MSTQDAPAGTLPPRPEVAPAAPWRLPEPRTTTLANGMRAILLHVPGQYVVSVRVSLPVPLRVSSCDAGCHVYLEAIRGVRQILMNTPSTPPQA